jgi:GT2 family glycosyltransferase
MENTVNPELSIIIVNWNTADLLKACLKSVYKHSPSISFEIIIFDNNSEDYSREMLKSFPQVKIIFNSRNIGFAAANNRAAEICRSEYLLLLNPDTEIRSNIFTPALNFIKKSSYGVLGARLRLPDGNVQVSSGNFLSLQTMIFQNVYFVLKKTGFIKTIPFLSKLSGVSVSQLIKIDYLWDPYRNHEVDWISGAFFLLSRRDFYSVGKFDESFFLFGEEIDLCYRLRQQGIKAVFWGQDEIFHHSGASIKEFPTENIVRHYNSALLFYKKHYSCFHVALYKSIKIISFIFSISVISLTIVFKNRESRKKLIQRRSAYFRLISNFISDKIDNTK